MRCWPKPVKVKGWRRRPSLAKMPALHLARMTGSGSAHRQKEQIAHESNGIAPANLRKTAREGPFGLEFANSHPTGGEFMLNRCLVLRIVLAAVMTVNAAGASGQPYTNKTIRFVTSPPGGGNDVVARLLAQGISSSLGQPVIVDNRPSVLASEFVSKAPPDGHTILIQGGAFLTGHLMQKTPYDPIRDFVPISLLTISPNVLVVHPSLPVKSVKELIALAKARPGELNYASGSAGAQAHLGAELFNAMAGVKIMHIPYKGLAAAIGSLIAGETQISLATTASSVPHIKTGRLRGLAVTSAKPSALAPGLPTIAASGLPGYEAVQSNALYAPAKTPAAIVSRLHQESIRILNQPDVNEKLFNVGLEIVGSTPEQLAAYMKSEIAVWGKVIRNAGIRAE
jgi:tripartite-type tricarboxylate transporter receptor subunit TctC